MGYNGTVVYDLLGSGKDGNSSAVGMTEGDCTTYIMISVLKL